MVAKNKQNLKRKPVSKKTSKKGKTSSVGSFFKGVVLEFKKVNWPTGPQLLQHTLVVVGIVALFAVVIYAFDVVLGYAKGLLM